MMTSFVPNQPSTTAPRHMGAPTREDRRTVTAGPAGTLWTVAAEHLGGDATDWEIAREWPRWHQHNLSRIGPDPARLRSGTVLRIPPPSVP